MKSISQKLSSDPSTGLLCLFAFILPLNKEIPVYIMFCMAIYFIVAKKYKASTRVFIRSKALLALVIFYLLHVVGMIYTSNVVYGLTDLQGKLSFLVFPLLISGFDIDSERRNRIFYSFITGCTLSVLLFLVLSLLTYLQTGNTNDFFYKGLSHWYHPAYLSFYYSLAILMACYFLFSASKMNKKFWLSVIISLIFFAVMLLSARTATAACMFSLAIYPVLFYGKKIFSSAKLKRYVASMVFMTLMFILAVKGYNRYEQVERAIENYSPETNRKPIVVQEEENSTNSRFHIWKFALAILADNPIAGVGTGDVRDELQKSYKEGNYEYGSTYKLNAHNQFLQTGVGLGIIGIIGLIAVFAIPAFQAITNRKYLLLLFLCIMFLNCLTESVLERQVGILFFCFFFSLFNKNSTVE